MSAQKRMSWDERRRLAYAIANLSPPDLSGVLLILEGSGKKSLVIEEHPIPIISKWDSMADKRGAPRLPPMHTRPIQMDCTIDLDSADTETLNQLQQYVDQCYLPHYIPRENCMICEGCWSNGEVIACGNDECDTKIHEECYGVVLREDSDGPWYCPSCLFGRQLTCAICMHVGGALKPLTTSVSIKDGTEDLRWVHVLCALAIPELMMRNVPTLEPVDGFEEIENGRFRYLCGICRKRGGASIICDHENCNVGMHPLCAANAGYMLGSETKPLAIYCEKHVPTRQVDAKRWISDEDLVEEIMNENTTTEEDQEIRKEPHSQYAFILNSTPALYAQQKLLGNASILPWGPTPTIGVKSDTKPSMFQGVKLPTAGALEVQTRRPLVFPPPPTTTDRISLPPFPLGEELMNAIIDYLVKEQDEWVRARVIQWESTRQMHLLQLITSGQKLWAQLSATNTLVLCLPDEITEVSHLEGQRIQLYRPVRRGVAEWRLRPRMFGPATSG